MARVIAYTRVSSEEQTRGSSLGDQSDRISAWLESNGHSLVAAYSEHGSGGSAQKRKEFQRMMAETTALKPDILIIDSCDRFARQTMDGGKYISQLTEIGVRLAVIEHDEGRILDMNEYSDRQYVSNALLIADGERDRMSKRQIKRYATATTSVNRPPWGVVLEAGPRSRRRLVPDADKVPIIAEIDRRILAGHGMPKVVEWLRDVAPGSFNAPTSLTRMLRDVSDTYVIAGVRSAETQARLREMFAARRHVFGRDRKPRTTDIDPIEQLKREVSGEAPPQRPALRDHLLAGIVGCGRCVDAGREASKSLMAGYYRNGNDKNQFALSCAGMRGQTRIHGRWSIAVAHVIPLLNEKLIKLRDNAVADAVLERWATEPLRPGGTVSERDALERQLALCDEEEAAIEARVSAAFAMLSNGRPGVAAEAERQIERSHANRLAVSAKRASIATRLAALPAPRLRRLGAIDRDELRVNAEALLTGYQIDAETGSRWVDVDIRDVLAKWVRLIGPPILYRDGPGDHDRPFIVWPFLDAIVAGPAPDYARP